MWSRQGRTLSRIYKSNRWIVVPYTPLLDCSWVFFHHQHWPVLLTLYLVVSYLLGNMLSHNWGRAGSRLHCLSAKSRNSSQHKKPADKLLYRLIEKLQSKEGTNALPRREEETPQICGCRHWVPYHILHPHTLSWLSCPNDCPLLLHPNPQSSSSTFSTPKRESVKSYTFTSRFKQELQVLEFDKPSPTSDTSSKPPKHFIMSKLTRGPFKKGRTRQHQFKLQATVPFGC